MSRPIFCDKCHREVARWVDDGKNIKIVQRGRAVISMQSNSTTSVALNCPQGHVVKVKTRETGELNDVWRRKARENTT